MNDKLSLWSFWMVSISPMFSVLMEWCKIGEPSYVFTILDWASLYEWYIARLVVNIGLQKDMCYDNETSYMLIMLMPF